MFQLPGITARDCVLGNPDLLERILLACPTATILHSQRVSRVWKIIILSSFPLQQALFLRAEPRKTNPIGSTRWKTNPLLEAAFPAWFAEIRNRYHMPGIKAFDELDWTDQRRQAFTRAEASWRRMLPVQPAIGVLEIKNFSHGKVMDGLSNDVAYMERGLRMGTLYDLTEGHIARHRVSSFVVIWPRGKEEVVHGQVAVGNEEDEEDHKRKQQSPPPPPSPPPRPAPIKTSLRNDSLVSAGPNSPPLPSPWVIGSLVSTRVEEDASELQRQYDDSDVLEDDDDADSLCGDVNYGPYATLILAHVQQCYPGHLPSERKYKSKGQEPVAIEAGKHRFRQHGGTWEELTSS